MTASMEQVISEQATLPNGATADPIDPDSGLVARAVELVRRPAIMAMFDQAMVSGASFLSTVLIGRFSDADNLGLYALSMSIVLGLLAVQMSLMTTPYAVHHHHDGVNPHTYAGSTLVMQLTMLAIACAGLLVACLVTGGTARVMLWTMLLAGPLLLLREFVRRMAYARLAVGKALAIDGPVVIVQLLGLGLLAFRDKLSAPSAFVALGTAAAVGAMIGLLGLWRNVAFDRHALKPDVRRSWSFGRWIAGAQFLEVANTHGTSGLVIITLGTTATGIYAACFAIVLLCNPFMLAVGNILTPRAAKTMSHEGPAALRRLIFRAAGLLGVVMSIFCAGLFIWGDTLVRLLYGDEYGGNGMLIGVLGLTFLIGAVGMAFNDGIRALGRTEVEFGATLIDSVVTLGLGLLGLLTFGLIGLAWANLIGSVGAVALQTRAFLRLSNEAVAEGK